MVNENPVIKLLQIIAKIMVRYLEVHLLIIKQKDVFGFLFSKSILLVIPFNKKYNISSILKKINKLIYIKKNYFYKNIYYFILFFLLFFLPFYDTKTTPIILPSYQLPSISIVDLIIRT